MKPSAPPAARERDPLDVVDRRLLEWLRLRAAAGDSPAFRAVAACLLSVCGDGSLCLPLEKISLAHSLRRFLAANDAEQTAPAPEALAEAFLEEARRGLYAAVLGGPEDAKPLILHRERLYFHRHFHAEKTLAEGLRLRLRPDAFSATEASEKNFQDRLGNILRETLEENPIRLGGTGSPALALSKAQKWALVAALRERFFLLSGGPGTGKTAWTTAWLRALMRLHAPDPARIRLCAPTGRAAQRLRESLRAGLGSAAADENGMDAAALLVPVETLHRLLGYQPRTGLFARNADDPLEADWVLLDEASMADAFLLAALVKALPPRARLILVGDADQLPSVEAGSALGELLPRDRVPALPPAAWDAIAALFPEDAPSEAERIHGPVPAVIFDQSHRAGGDILRLARAVNSGDAEGLLEILGDPVSIQQGFAEPGFAANATEGRGSEGKSVLRLEVPGNDFARALPDLLHAYAASVFLERRVRGKNYAERLDAFRKLPAEEEEAALPLLWEFLADARILAPVRYGPLSGGRANRILRARLEPLFARRGDARSANFHGAPLIVTRNDARTGLSNGESGVWLESAGGPHAFFPRPEGWLRLPAPLLPAVEPGFASTVHKSQGSEYDEVLLILPDAGNRLLARETLYTALTRARNRVRVFGTEAALLEAARNRLHRHSGLRDYFGGEGA